MSVYAHVDPDTLDTFAKLGAVSAGIHTSKKWHHYGGVDHWVPFDDLVYFFDARGEEIGYWSVIQRYFDNRPMLFDPPRVWDSGMKSRLNVQRFFRAGATPPQGDPDGKEDKSSA